MGSVLYFKSLVIYTILTGSAVRNRCVYLMLARPFPHGALIIVHFSVGSTHELYPRAARCRTHALINAVIFDFTEGVITTTYTFTCGI